LIAAVARRANLNWQESEALIQKVHDENRGRVVKRQTPLLLIMGLGTAIGGAYLLIIGISSWALWSILIGLAMLGGSAWGLGSVVLDLVSYWRSER
jgi:hypothetical protein